MKRNLESERSYAVDCYLNGEPLDKICKEIKRSKSWLLKWIKRYDPEDQSWNSSKPKKPLSCPLKISSEMEEIVKIIRLNLYNKGIFCGAQAILWELEDMNLDSIPSIRTINRILKRNDLTHRRTGRYIPKGKKYPALTARKPNDIHQADIVGPCYLKGSFRFYSLNVVDLFTGRCAIEPLSNCCSESMLAAFWSIWLRLGIPENVQVDNELTFYGSNRYPRGMGFLIRLCLNNNVNPWFIPQREPWRNGVIEHFNDLYRQKFIDVVSMKDFNDLCKGSLAFENRHNINYRYSKLKGKTPMQVLLNSKYDLKLPKNKEYPKHPLKKPNKGHYNIIRFIRHDLNLNIFSEKFPIPSDYMYEYVIATVYVKEQKLKVFHENIQVEEFEYKI